MAPKFTGHGKERADERGITPEEIDGILASEDTLVIASEYDELAVLSFGMLKGKLWAVVSNWQSGEVITVRRAHEKERRIYEQAQENRP